MSRIKKWAAAFALTFATCAQASERHELAEIIAGCAGRLSAELEFAWLMSDPDSELLNLQRLRFVEILESLGPPSDPRQQLALRIDTKMAHARLLTTAYFGADAQRAVWARRHAVMQRSACQDMLLDG